jgi:hypothetical protein
MKPQAAARPTTVGIVLEESYRRIPTALGHLLEDLLRAVTALVALAAVALWWLTATPVAEAAAAGAPHTGLEGEPVVGAIVKAEATQPRHRCLMRRLQCPSQNRGNSTQEILQDRRERRLPRLLCSTSQSAAPGEIQASGDYQVRCEARPSIVAQVLRPLHRERWWQQRHKVPILPFLPRPGSTYMARFTRQVLDRQVGPAQGAVH